jgi:hypothetical protein
VGTGEEDGVSRDVVVIGGSSGAITSLRQVVRTLPAQFPAAIR